MSGFSSPDNIEYSVDRSPTEIRDTPIDELSDKYQLERCISWIKQNNFEKTCLQFPDEQLNDGVSVALHLENALGKTFYIMADTAFGSCCIDNISAEHVDADSVIHFGHACLSTFSKLPVLYIFDCQELDIKKFKDALKTLNDNHVIVFYDDIYHHLYSELCDSFKNSNVHISRIITPGDKVKKERSQRYLLGRMFELSSSNDEVAVFLGEDCVTLQNLFLALPDMKWYYYNKNEELVTYEMDRSKFLMKKYHKIEVVKDANIIGILIGTLGIENYLDAIERVKCLAKNHGKKYYILAVGRPNVCKLANFPEIDVFVWIACSENVSKDFKDYYKPVVSLFEVEIALGNHLLRGEYLNDFKDILANYSALEDEEDDDDDDEDDLLDESKVSLTSGKIRTRTEVLDLRSSSQLQERMVGALTGAKGAEFLSNRSWRGLELNSENQDVLEAGVGRIGIAQGYANEFGNMKDSSNVTSLSIPSARADLRMNLGMTKITYDMIDSDEVIKVLNATIGCLVCHRLFAIRGSDVLELREHAHPGPLHTNQTDLDHVVRNAIIFQIENDIAL